MLRTNLIVSSADFLVPEVFKTPTFKKCASAKIPILSVDFFENLLAKPEAKSKVTDSDSHPLILQERLENNTIALIGRGALMSNARINGKYVHSGEYFGNHKVYKHVDHEKYVFYSEVRDRWKISLKVSDTSRIYAYNKEDNDILELTTPWKVAHPSGHPETDYHVRFVSNEYFDEILDQQLRRAQSLSVGERQRLAKQTQGIHFKLAETATRAKKNPIDLTKRSGICLRQRKYQLGYRLLRDQYEDHCGHKLPKVLAGLLEDRRSHLREALKAKRLTDPEPGSPIIQCDADVLSSYYDAEMVRDEQNNVFHALLEAPSYDAPENKFYIIQMFRSAAYCEEGEPAKLYVLRKWGRYGEPAGSLLNDFLITAFNRNMKEAETHFRDHFERLSGQPFEDRLLDENIPNRYFLIPLAGQILEDLPAEPQSEEPLIKKPKVHV